MSKLYELLMVRRISGDVGVEIETEYRTRAPQPEHCPRDWAYKPDGSLRMIGREFVLRLPIGINDLKPSLERITAVINRSEFDLVRDSPRTGVHVHVNVSEFEPLHILNSITAYWLLENLLIKHCSEETREGNNYCLRIADCEGAVWNAARNVAEADFRQLAIGQNKYMSQNLTTITHYQSLEYRGMRGTTDAEEIREWASSLWRMTRVAQGLGNPAKIFELVETRDPEEILRTFFAGEEAFQGKLKSFDGWDKLVKSNLDLIDTFAYAVNWDIWNRRFLPLIRLPAPEPVFVDSDDEYSDDDPEPFDD